MTLISSEIFFIRKKKYFATRVCSADKIKKNVEINQALELKVRREEQHEFNLELLFYFFITAHAIAASGVRYE